MAPKTCMARSTTRCCRRAATTLMAATWARTARAATASPWSSSQAACSTSRRAWSISMRDSASHSCTLACSASGLPKAVRSSARSVARESASSHCPMVRMQWCTRPGPRRACAIAKPAPQSPSRWSAGTRTLRSKISQCPSGAWWCSTGMLRTICTPGVPTGTSTMLWRWWPSSRSASALRHSTMSSWHCGCAAPVMNHLRPLSTRPSPSRRTVVCRLVGSDEATSGSLIAKAERIWPCSNGTSQRVRWAGVAKRCSSSMLPVSGAWQLNTSAAQGRRPMASASGA